MNSPCLSVSVVKIPVNVAQMKKASSFDEAFSEISLRILNVER